MQGTEDESLAQAYKTMERALRQLESATAFVTFTNTEEIKSATQETNMTVRQMELRTRRMEDTLDKVNEITVNYLYTKMLEHQSRSFTKKREHESQHGKDPSTSRYAAFILVKRALPIKADAAVQDRDIEYSFVKGTSTWLLEEESYKGWSRPESKEPFLVLSGSAGMGKSCLAFSVIRDLKRSMGERSLTDAPRSSIAYFYFKDEHEELRSVVNALASAVLQIAEQNATYCEQVAADLSRPNSAFEFEDGAVTKFWERFFESKFRSASDGHAYLILDGLDEANATQRAELLQLFTRIRLRKLNIHVLVTSRPGLRDQVGKDNIQRWRYKVIDVTKEKMMGDMQLVIRARLKTHIRLRRLRVQTKRKIINRLQQTADSKCNPANARFQNSQGSLLAQTCCTLTTCFGD